MAEFMTTFDTASNYITGSSVLISGSKAQLQSIDFEGFSLRFNGVDSKAEVPHTGSVWDWDDSGSYTIEFWVKPTGINEMGVNKGDGYGGWFTAGMVGDYVFQISPYPLDLGGVVTNAWNHIAIVIKQNLMGSFVNGYQRHFRYDTFNPSDACRSVSLQFGYSLSSYRSCSISQFRLSDKILYPTGSSFTPSASFNCESNTTALYKINEGFGTNIADSTSAQNDGTIMNPDWAFDANEGKYPSMYYLTGSAYVYKTSGEINPYNVKFTSFKTFGSSTYKYPRFQLSNDGNIWNYYNGTSWVSASINQDNGEFNIESDVNANINKFSSGNLYVRTYLYSNTIWDDCYVDTIQIGCIYNQNIFKNLIMKRV